MLQHKFLETASGRIHYVVHGQGLPLVLVHGFCEDHAVWLPWAEPLADQYRMIMPDLPGFGKTDLPSEAMAMKNYATTVLHILQAEGLQTAPMLGHSMGGYTVLQMALHFPKTVSGIGLFHSSALADDEQKKADRLRVADFVRQHGRQPFVAELVPKLFADPFRTSHSEFLQQWIHHCTDVSADAGVVAASLAMRNRDDTTDVLRHAGFPVLFIIGKEDKAILPERVLQQTHLPKQAVLALLDGVGHMGMFEEPQRCEEAVRQWLSLCFSK